MVSALLASFLKSVPGVPAIFLKNAHFMRVPGLWGVFKSPFRYLKEAEIPCIYRGFRLFLLYLKCESHQ